MTSYGICKTCFILIIIRSGSHHWKANYPWQQGKHREHKPHVTFSSGFDARRVRKEMVNQYWLLPKIQHNNYTKAFRKAIDLAIKELVFVEPD